MKIAAIGGYETVGRNMTAIKSKEETIAIECGIRVDMLQIYEGANKNVEDYTNEQLIGMDVIPDYRILEKMAGCSINNNNGKFVAQVLSHAHLDHIGATGIIKPDTSIIGTPYTIEMVRAEYKDGDFFSLPYRENFPVSDNISVELIETTHSIPNCSIVVIRTAEGNIVYASDFKLDNYSTIARPDYQSLGRLGQEGVKALIVESTRVKDECKTPSEKIAKEMVRDTMESIADQKGIIIATTFSTHAERLQSIIDVAEKIDRKILMLGRSLYRQSELSKRFDYLDVPLTAQGYSNGKAIANALRHIKKKDRNDYLLMVTGHQGELRSVLSKMADGEFPFKFERGDSVVFCASTIPTQINYLNRYVLEAKLKSRGVRIFKDVHVSGHASKEEHRQLIEMLKPEHIIPCHGSLDMRINYVSLGEEHGYRLGKNLHIINNRGSVTI